MTKFVRRTLSTDRLMATAGARCEPASVSSVRSFLRAAR